MIHLLRAVKYTLKLLKLTAPLDKTRGQGNEKASEHIYQPVHFYPVIEEAPT